MNEAETPTPDERLMSALAHISVLLPLMGVIAPIVIYITQKEKSRYIAFQSLQAMTYQFVIIIGWFLSWGCYMCSFFGIFGGLMLAAATEASVPEEAMVLFTGLSPLLVLGAIMIIGFAFIIYGVVGAFNAFQGKPFRYLLIGDRVERFMQSGTETTPAP